MRIVVDTREQRPFFTDCAEVDVVAGKLESGDYSIAGLESMVTVERKTLDDLAACLGRNHERFERELERLRGYEAACVVVESPYEMLFAGQYMAALHPKVAIETVASYMARFRLPFYFAQDKADAERFTHSFLQNFVNMVRKRYEAAGVTVVKGDMSCTRKQ